MSDPTAANNTTSVSQHPSTPIVETVREEIDIGDFVLGPDQASQQPPQAVTQDFGFSGEQTQEQSLGGNSQLPSTEVGGGSYPSL